MKTVVSVIVYNRHENIVRWVRCWEKSNQTDAELVVVQSVDDKVRPDQTRAYCEANGIKYFQRPNIGMDIGAFKEVCEGKIEGFPDFDYLLWVTDDCIPMDKNFVSLFTNNINGLNCLEISKIKSPLHVRTTGFCITKDIAKRLVIPPIVNKRDCYNFEHRSRNTLMLQVIRMGYDCRQLVPIEHAPLWDTGNRAHLNRWEEHHKVFSENNKICIATTFDRNYKEAGKTLFNSIRRHTICEGIDFKVITADQEVIKEFGAENCHIITDEIKSRYANVTYSKQLPPEKYSSSWYRYEVFNMTDYDRVICIDSDCICVEDISYLFSEELNEYDLISVEDHFVSKLLPPLYTQLEANGWDFTGLYNRVSAGQVDIQPAVFVINKRVISTEWYNKLVTYANSSGFTYSIDQGILNDFIYQNGFKIKLLPIEWNYQDLYATRIPGLTIPEKPIIIHCQESKPFKLERGNVDGRIQRFYDQWWDEHREIGRMKGKICITTTFDYNYKRAGDTLFKTIRRYTDVSDIDFKVITDDEKVIAELGAENCHIITPEIKERYANVQYISDIPKERYYSSWYRYEIFNMTDYDRVICIDSDCICIRDISYLFSEDLDKYDLVSTEDMIVSRMFKKSIATLEKNHGLNLRGLDRRIKAGQVDIQPALIVANKKIVNHEWYRRLLEYANTSPHTYSIDEGILNDFIYMDGLNIKILPMEWNYMDTYWAQILELPEAQNPYIVHCQESKPFKKEKKDVNKRIHKWHDRWWQEANWSEDVAKTIVVIIVWNRYENLRLWINCWNQCDTSGAELVIVHNLEKDNERYAKLCRDNGIKYVPRKNIGFDLGAFQDVCKERLSDFPNNWDKMIWLTDDCIPMSKTFVKDYLDKYAEDKIPCYEISDVAKRHIRTTGFSVTKEISKQLTFPADPMQTREDCYDFEHRSASSLFNQIIGMGKTPVMLHEDLSQSSLWDVGVRGYLNLMRKHESVFEPLPNPPAIKVESMLDNLAIAHASDKSSLYHNYAVKYDKILSPYMHTFTDVLEIGVSQGQSTKMWTDYFTKATIHGADINRASAICEKYSNRIKFHVIDQRNRAQLKNLEQYSPFDLIIDDGNHFWMEQILTFETLFPYIRPGGIYIVEDTTTSYWREYKNNPISPVEYFKKLVDDVNLKGARGGVPKDTPQLFSPWKEGWHRREDCHVNVPSFESIQFYNGFIVIYKR